MKLLKNNYTAIHTPNNDNFFLKIKLIKNNYKYLLITFLFCSNSILMSAQNYFLENQLSFERVKEAYREKAFLLKSAFKEKGLNYPPKEILLVSYKAEGELQVWVKEKDKYKMFKVYEVCMKSGDFGPKRKQGDKQVPEGFYYINVFNPESDYHLSLGINYPNSSDRV